MTNQTSGPYTLGHLAVTAIVAILVGGWVVILTVLLSDLDLNRVPTSLAPCPTEDSTDCYWIASERGNGAGTSFVNIDGNHIQLTKGTQQ